MTMPAGRGLGKSRGAPLFGPSGGPSYLLLLLPRSRRHDAHGRARPPTVMDTRQPPPEAPIDLSLARALVLDQHPQLARRELVLVDEGWDNVTFRLGRDHALRVPRRRAAVPLLLNERRWLPLLAPRLPVAAPVPILDGAPSARLEWPWSIVRWVHGVTADTTPLRDDQEPVLARALRALHRSAPADAPANPFRGVPLSERREAVEERLERLHLTALRGPWARALDAPPARERVWLHGDLHPRNVVVRDGRLAGIIDWGDLCAGDPATDLACAWMLFDRASRHAFLEAYAPSEEVEARAAGWAVFFTSALLDTGEPRHVRIGEAALGRLAALRR